MVHWTYSAIKGATGYQAPNDSMHCTLYMQFSDIFFSVWVDWKAAPSLFTEPVYTFHSAKGPLDQLSADYGYLYQCLTDSINFKLNGNNSNVNVTLTQIDFQPFDVRDGKFGNGKDWALNFNLY